MASPLVTTLLTSGCSAGITAGCFCLVSRRKLLGCPTDEVLLAALEDRGYETAAFNAESKVQKEYEKIDELGKGASGTVCKVLKKSTGEELAMKIIEKGDADSMNDEESLQTEIRCMRRLRHRHIVNIQEVFESQTKMWIIMDCADGGMLYDRILALDHFSEKTASVLMKQVLKAVHYMHSNGVVHRDLKPENILLETAETDSDIKVADFGLAVDLHWTGFNPEESMRMKSSADIKGGFCGSPICMAPEVAVKNATYGPQCDLWSLGCMTYEMLCGKPPFIAKTAKMLFKVIRSGKRPSFEEECWKSVSKEAAEIVSNMLRREPEDRPSAREALEHPWFKAAKDRDRHLADSHETIKIRMTNQASNGFEEPEVDKTLQGTKTAEQILKSTAPKT